MKSTSIFCMLAVTLLVTEAVLGAMVPESDKYAEVVAKAREDDEKLVRVRRNGYNGSGGYSGYRGYRGYRGFRGGGNGYDNGYDNGDYNGYYGRRGRGRRGRRY